MLYADFQKILANTSDVIAMIEDAIEFGYVTKDDFLEYRVFQVKLQEINDKNPYSLNNAVTGLIHPQPVNNDDQDGDQQQCLKQRFSIGNVCAVHPQNRSAG